MIRIGCTIQPCFLEDVCDRCDTWTKKRNHIVFLFGRFPRLLSTTTLLLCRRGIWIRRKRQFHTPMSQHPNHDSLICHCIPLRSTRIDFRKMCLHFFHSFDQLLFNYLAHLSFFLLVASAPLISSYHVVLNRTDRYCAWSASVFNSLSLPSIQRYHCIMYAYDIEYSVSQFM